MKVDVLNIQGKQTGKQVDLPEDIFGIEPNDHVMYLAVKQYNAHQRQGTHKAKERGEIKGSTRKIKRQKGTGTARAGSIKNPLFVGGGRVFGPRPRKYTIKLNKKVKTLARKSALSAKAKAGQLVIVEDFTFDAPKTKEFKNILNNFGLSDKKCLFVNAADDKSLYLSCRNLPKASMTTVDSLNVYEVLNANCVLIAESSVNRLKEAFSA